jgi:hypothetical protein
MTHLLIIGYFIRITFADSIAENDGGQNRGMQYLPFARLDKRGIVGAQIGGRPCQR